MNINFEHIQLLLYLEQEDMVLSRAAEKLRISQPSASRKLRELETEVGERLIERNGKRLVGLTPFATRLMEDVEKIQMSFNNLSRLSTERKVQQSEFLRIATTHAQARYFLPDIIERFQAKWSRVEIRIFQDLPANIADHIQSGSADLAICTEVITQNPGFSFDLGYRWHHGVCVPSDHPLAQGPIDLARISEFPILTYVQGITGREALDETFASSQLSPNITIAAADTDVLKTFIRMGMGCGIIGAMTFDPIQDKGLVFRSVEGLPTFRIATAWQTGRYLPAHIRSFVDLVQRQSPFFEASFINKLSSS